MRWDKERRMGTLMGAVGPAKLGGSLRDPLGAFGFLCGSCTDEGSRRFGPRPGRPRRAAADAACGLLGWSLQRPRGGVPLPRVAWPLCTCVFNVLTTPGRVGDPDTREKDHYAEDGASTACRRHSGDQGAARLS